MTCCTFSFYCLQQSWNHLSGRSERHWWSRGVYYSSVSISALMLVLIFCSQTSPPASRLFLFGENGYQYPALETTHLILLCVVCCLLIKSIPLIRWSEAITSRKEMNVQEATVHAFCAHGPLFWKLLASSRKFSGILPILVYQQFSGISLD